MPGPVEVAPRSKSDYIYGIDLVRFACAVGVGVYHLTALIPKIAWLMPFGWIGVQIFFVISGLVIANSASGESTRRFIVGRFLRLYPTAWCVAIVIYPLFLWGFGKHGNRFLPLLLSLVLLHGPFLASAYWTLPIELSFYCLVFLLIRFRGFKNIQLFAIILILWSAPYLLALFLNSSGIVNWPWIDLGYGAPNMTLLRHGPYFGLGILVWLFKEGRINKVGTLAAGLAVLLGFMEIYSRYVELQPKFTRSVPLTHALWADSALSPEIAFCIGFVAILLSVQFNRLFPMNAAVRKATRLLGLMTYPFYLLHQRAGGYALYQIRRVGAAPFSSVAVALICTGVLSLIIALYFEPALRNTLRRHVGVLSPARKEPVSQTS